MVTNILLWEKILQYFNLGDNMEWNDIIKYVKENVKHYELEHNDTVIRLIARYVEINDIFTMSDVVEIHIVKKDNNVWFNEKVHIQVDDIEKIWIA